MSERHSPIPEDEQRNIIRKLSRTTLHASQRRREKLFNAHTAGNSEKIKELSQEKPIFYKEGVESEQRIQVEPDFAKLLPQEFFDNPTQWIESQSNIHRDDTAELPAGESIAELWGRAYDVSKVKRFSVGEGEEMKDIVSKRIDPKTKEIERARRAYEAGIPTPHILAEIHDQGNTYAFFEGMKGIAMNSNRINRYDRLKFFVPTTVFSTKAFHDDLQALGYNELPQGLREKLQKCWEDSRHDIYLKEVLGWINSAMNKHRIERKRWSTIDEILEGEKDLFLDYKTPDFRAVLQSLGVDDASSPVDRWELEENINRLVQPVSQRMIEYEKRWGEIIDTEIFGYNPNEEIARLQKLCGDHGIRHVDLDPRNLIIEWDVEHKRPRKGEDGKATMHIIDWEERPSTKPQ